MNEIEDKIENLIAESGNDALMDAWLEYLFLKKENAERLESKLQKKDPMIIGAIIGAVIGYLFTED